jgi:hypothetical protein
VTLAWRAVPGDVIGPDALSYILPFMVRACYGPSDYSIVYLRAPRSACAIRIARVTLEVTTLGICPMDRNLVENFSMHG